MQFIWDGFSAFGFTFGYIGIRFTSFLGQIAANAIAILVIILAIIGLITVIRFFTGKRGKKETPGEKWLRTGKM